jgi:hypothetical protein
MNLFTKTCTLQFYSGSAGYVKILRNRLHCCENKICDRYSQSKKTMKGEILCDKNYVCYKDNIKYIK